MERPKVLSEPWRLECWSVTVLRLLSSKALRDGLTQPTTIGLPTSSVSHIFTWLSLQDTKHIVPLPQCPHSNLIIYLKAVSPNQASLWGRT